MLESTLVLFLNECVRSVTENGRKWNEPRQEPADGNQNEARRPLKEPSFVYIGVGDRDVTVNCNDQNRDEGIEHEEEIGKGYHNARHFPVDPADILDNGGNHERNTK